MKLSHGDNGLGTYAYTLTLKDGKNIPVGEGHVGSLEIVSHPTGGTTKYGKVSNGPINFLINLHKCSALGPEVLATSVHLVCNCLVLTCTFHALSLKVCCTEVCPLDLVVNFHSVPVVSSTVGSDGT